MPRFQVGQAVWDTRRAWEQRKGVNGYIVSIDWEEREIQVRFPRTEYTDIDNETYDFEDFRNHWTDKFNGGWLLE